jgi:carbon-monoxide dehydrogenase medium subunit
VDHFTTSLAHDEVITSVVLPPIPSGTRATYLKFLPRTADDYATVSVAATMRLAADGTIADVRLVLGAVGPTPLRLRRVEEALRGRAPDRVDEAVAMVPDEVQPLDDLRGSASYKREMARVWTARAIARLAR